MKRPHTSSFYAIGPDGEPFNTDLEGWCKWRMETADNHIGYDMTPDGVLVSTIFLGVDRRMPIGRDWQNKPPILWETMIHHEGQWINVDRYSSRLDAERGHAAALAGWRDIVAENERLGAELLALIQLASKDVD